MAPSGFRKKMLAGGYVDLRLFRQISMANSDPYFHYATLANLLDFKSGKSMYFRQINVRCESISSCHSEYLW